MKLLSALKGKLWYPTRRRLLVVVPCVLLFAATFYVCAPIATPLWMRGMPEWFSHDWRAVGAFFIILAYLAITVLAGFLGWFESPPDGSSGYHLFSRLSNPEYRTRQYVERHHH